MMDSQYQFLVQNTNSRVPMMDFAYNRNKESFNFNFLPQYSTPNHFHNSQILSYNNFNKKEENDTHQSPVVYVKPKSYEKVFTPRSNDGKKTLALDLDETLVSSSSFPSNGYDIFRCFVVDGAPSNTFIKIRPGTCEFIQRISKIFHLIIFTSSYKEYADIIQEKIDPQKLIEDSFWRDFCIFKGMTSVKNLKILDTDLKNVIIVDNNPFAYSLQPQNGLPIKSWYGNPDDQELIQLERVLTFLATVDDVRKYIPLFVDNSRGEILYHKLKEIQENFYFIKAKNRSINGEFETKELNENNNSSKNIEESKRKKEINTQENSHKIQFGYFPIELKKEFKFNNRNMSHFESCSSFLFNEIPDEMTTKGSEEKNKKIDDKYFKINVSSFSKYIISDIKHRAETKFILDEKNHCFIYKNTFAHTNPQKQITQDANYPIDSNLILNQSELNTKNPINKLTI